MTAVINYCGFVFFFIYLFNEKNTLCTFQRDTALKNLRAIYIIYRQGGPAISLLVEREEYII